MLRKFVWFLALATLTVIGALALSCGSSSSPKPCTGTYNVVGNWQLTVTNTSSLGSLTEYGAIDSAGLALFFDNTLPSTSGDSAELPVITGSCSFSGNVNAYPEPGGPNAGLTVTDAAQGTITSATAISGSFTGTGNNPSGTFTGAAFTTLTGAVAALSGAKTGAVQGAINGQPVVLPLIFTPSGTNNSMAFSTNAALSPNCSVSGSFTEVGTNDVFDVSMTFASTGGAGCAMTGTFTGLGFESSSDYFDLNNKSAETYLYADVLASSNTFVIEIY